MGLAFSCKQNAAQGRFHSPTVGFKIGALARVCWYPRSELAGCFSDIDPGTHEYARLNGKKHSQQACDASLQSGDAGRSAEFVPGRNVAGSGWEEAWDTLFDTEVSRLGG